MKTKTMGLVIVFLLGIMLMPLMTQPAAAQASGKIQKCTLPFDASVTQGPSAGTKLSGKLTFQVDQTGDFTGELVTASAAKIAVVGQVVGRAVSLVFELEKATDTSKGSYIFGTGATLHRIMDSKDCGGVLGGTFAGPKEGDTGHWAGFCFKIVKLSGADIVGYETICELQG
jgi:hypothetical protein